MIVESHRIIFQGVASLIIARPALILASCLLVSVIISTGSVYIRFKDNFRTGYSESDAPSVAEHIAYRTFYNLSSPPYLIGLVGECGKGDSMLRAEVFNQMRMNIDRGLSAIIPTDDPNEKRHTLKDYLAFSSEAHFAAIEEWINYPNDNIRIEYPTSTVFLQHLSMRRVMYNVNNGSVGILWYVMAFRPENPTVLAKIKSVELMWYHRLKKQNNSMLRLYLFGDELVDNEILVGSISTIPYLIVGGTLMLMVVFSALTRYNQKQNNSMLRLYLFGDELVDNEILVGSISTIPYLIVGGTLMLMVVFSALTRYNQSFIATFCLLLWTALCPTIAGVMAIAIFSFKGTPINCMMFITPFLVLGVGVDDAFLMIHNWFHSKEVDGSNRLSRMLVEVGPSVTLTSLTNVVAFLIGGSMSPPDVRSFCNCTATALMFGWLLQLFFFSPILLRYHSCSFDLPTLNTKMPDLSAYISFARFLHHRWVRAISVLVLVVYWSASAYSSTQMHVNFAPEKTFDDRSFLATAFDIKDRLGKDHEMIDILMNKSLGTVSELHEDLRHIRSIEYLCNNFTTWIEDYEAQYPTQNDSIQQFFASLPQFLDENPDSIRFVSFEYRSDGSVQVQQLALEICVQGMGSWQKRAMMAENLRARLPRRFSIYMYDSTVFDLILSTRRATTKSLVTTIVCLSLLCALFTPCVKAISLAVLSVVSISLDGLGGLGAWGADLDIIVMVNVVMAVGLTVDYTAHISYHCFTSDPSLSSEERIAYSIRAVAYPTIQAASTTVVCVMPLFFYSIYMYVTFTKTIILCSALGFIHAVFVVPLFFSMICH
ncbi:Patched-related protein 9 [Toxocara canis]|uniref:Patched-related protein 9 n=1 Tax=Toxocara canis TaxID=6265 RepID=A0A0B2VAC0_TOXCA|nr:Patched-related protein 9 [Toxocara canis]